MNKALKRILITVTIIVLIVIVAGMYKFNYLANQPGYDSDGNKIEETYQSDVLLKWFALKTSNDFYIKIPDTDIECKITEITDSDSLRYAKGYYTAGDEKGVVVIDNRGITALNQSSENTAYFVDSFSISNQGSGNFKYLGMFKLDYTAKTIDQIDSYFLGDRVKINSIKYDGNDQLHVELMIHSENQAMSESPSELKILELKVGDGNLLEMYQ